jgi:hypothetical protein
MNEDALQDRANRIRNDRARDEFLKFMRSVELETTEEEVEDSVYETIQTV